MRNISDEAVGWFILESQGYKKRDLSIWWIALLIALWVAAIALFACGTSFAFTTKTSYYTNIETHNRRCADGRFHNLSKEYCCASWDFKLGSFIIVSLPDGSKSIRVRVVDHGPAKVLYRKGRRLDLSAAAFKTLAPLSKGVINVKVSHETKDEV